MACGMRVKEVMASSQLLETRRTPKSLTDGRYRMIVSSSSAMLNTAWHASWRLGQEVLVEVLELILLVSASRCQ